ncbi:MAG: glutamate synthase large subunit, partial [Rhodospirillaceae bacterium]|nr:glutamate synthase large subunit [Rhodospirillaceae bacterium]
PPGKLNRLRSHETRRDEPRFGAHIDDLKPVIRTGTSDSAALDAVFELLVRSQRELPEVKSLLIPEAWEQSTTVPEAHRDFYAYSNTVMEPWDGPAAIAAYGGRWVLAGMDRNGLRPMRYVITGDGLLIVGSEAGMVKVDETEVVEKGRLGPGQMVAVNLQEGRFYKDGELKDKVAAMRPYKEWREKIRDFDTLLADRADESARMDRDTLRRRQVAVGWTIEDLELILHPMVEEQKEPTGSMGDDAPLAVLSDNYRGLHHFFRQSFSQVTNPAIDSLRERGVMSLTTRLGNLGNILETAESGGTILQLPSPVLLNGEFEAMCGHLGATAVAIDCTFDPSEKPNALRNAILRIRTETEDAVRGGCTHVILTDERVDAERVAVPMILATGAVHTHLVRTSLRTYVSINVRSAECLDVHYVAVLIGVGATTVNPYLAQEAIADRYGKGLFGSLGYAEALQRYRRAVDDGLLKVMSKMGISVISSFRGGYNFEAVGLSRTLVGQFFPGLPSRISGIGLDGIQRKSVAIHERAYSEGADVLPIGGFYRYRKGGEAHFWDGKLIHMLQSAVETDSYAAYRKYSEGTRSLSPTNLRDLLDFAPVDADMNVDDVESITEIRKRLVSPGISLGALSPEAHETLSIAMNRIGSKSDSGEGGEDPERYRPKENGDNPSSAIKQIASGRFGVTAEYLNNCSEIEIKIAQGAKPGEGGQLPGFKVSEMIARLRHSTPGVTLISPPPHHDIYSIEDLAQLIYDLKQINPDALVCVKLVARTGIGTIAAGVAKANADVILVSGHSGGTGASPQTSIKYAGLPWEMGLSEVHQVLTLNRLRHRVRLRVDGGIKTGRDVVMAAILGAEEFGIGTASLVAMGCILVRQCHSNTCPVGICTQDERLRDKFKGTPEKVVNLFSFVAEEVREILATLGAASLREIIGRTELLSQVSRGSRHLDDLDLNPILAQPDPGGGARHCTIDGRNEVPDALDARMIEDAAALFAHGEKMQLQYNVRNTDRAIGARLSSRITRQYGMDGLNPGHITVRLRGSAGQSLGAFAVQGLTLEVFGEANDYVGKGLSGGKIIVRPLTASPLASHRNTIVGNTVLYGATAGTLLAAGQAGERFAVRNSGATAVVEGCGSNGCEYMTGGTVVILGAVGANFAAGMTGGMAFVHDPDGDLVHRVNADTVIYQRMEPGYWADFCQGLIETHATETQSEWANRILNEWQQEREAFWQIVPKEMLDRLEHPIVTSISAAE